MKRIIIFLFLLSALTTSAQKDSSFIKHVAVDTSKMKLNLDATYNRPFLQMGKFPVTIGGYAEANSSYFGTDGVSEGISFQIPRVSIFLSSTIKKRIKFLSEIEFEEGGKEISIEFASMDIELHPLFNFRGGVIVNPIGSFNQNHDGPKWEFISRPISSTTIIPSTWNNVGFGLYGKYAHKNMVWAYEVYMTNGFDDKIIANEENRTWIPASKENPERFEESFNGVPLVTAKGSVRHRKVGEIGVSWMGGVYNKFEMDGVKIDERRRIDLYALDFNTNIPKANTAITAEWVWAMVELPADQVAQYGGKQQGGFIDIVQPVMKKKVLGWENATFNLAFRFEYADYNVGTFTETGANKFDHITAVVPGISFRPSPQTVLRANYRYHWERDVFGNPPSRTAGFQFGFATYF